METQRSYLCGLAVDFEIADDEFIFIKKSNEIKNN